MDGNIKKILIDKKVDECSRILEENNINYIIKKTLSFKEKNKVIYVTESNSDFIIYVSSGPILVLPFIMALSIFSIFLFNSLEFSKTEKLTPNILIQQEDDDSSNNAIIPNKDNKIDQAEKNESKKDEEKTEKEQSEAEDKTNNTNADNSNTNNNSTSTPTSPIQQNTQSKNYNMNNMLSTSNIRAGLYNRNNQEVVLKGVVLPNVDTSQFEASISKESLSSLKKNLKINMIRFTIAPTSTMDKNTIYSRVKKAIDNASSLEIYAIVDWGIMSITEPDPNRTLSNNNNKNTNIFDYADNFFNNISSYSKNNPYVMFEICNEPIAINSNSTEYQAKQTWDAVKRYANTIIPIIRKNSNNTIIVAGYSGVILDYTIKEPLSNYANIAYTFHCYPYNYDYNKYAPILKEAYNKKLTIISTELSPINAKIADQDKVSINKAALDQYINLYKTYNMSFAFFKFDFPWESGAGSAYNNWSMLKPINKAYYNTRCNWQVNRNLPPCLTSDVYIRHMSNLDLNTDLSKQFFCASNDNHCSNEPGKGYGVYSESGYYFYKLMNN